MRGVSSSRLEKHIERRLRVGIALFIELHARSLSAEQVDDHMVRDRAEPRADPPARALRIAPLESFEVEAGCPEECSLKRNLHDVLHSFVPVHDAAELARPHHGMEPTLIPLKEVTKRLSSGAVRPVSLRQGPSAR